ncbi:MAG TPA: RodZ domain-containing protein [Burkholderiales bacterium]
MSEPVGAELQRVREEQGLSVTEVAQQLKFAPRQIEALEQDRFELLPGGTFVRGMVRSYARLLKVDAQPLVERIAGRFDAPDANTLAARYSQPVPFHDNARRSTFMYLGLSLGVLAIGGGVAYQWYREHNAAAMAAKRAPAAAPVAATTPRAEPKVLVASADTAMPKMTPMNRAAPEPAKQAVASPKQIVAEARPAVVQTAAAEKPAAAKVAGPPGAMHRLVIRCEEEAWIEVKDANERMLVSSLNPKGAERVVRARGPLTLVIGNAEHVHVLHNDRPIDLAPHTKLAIARFTLP